MGTRIAKTTVVAEQASVEKPAAIPSYGLCQMCVRTNAGNASYGQYTICAFNLRYSVHPVARQSDNRYVSACWHL
jgi:hypothetical protein